jgi:fucose 4-O-acetylase-like acetyltransferase
MKDRLLYMDNIRIFLISYVIAGHVSVAYGAIGRGNWYYIEPASDMMTKAALYLFDMFAYSFLMAMFIFISGYFTPASLEKKGLLRFLKERTLRLMIPLLFYYFIIGPIVRFISMKAKGEAESFFPFLADMYQSGVYGYMGVMWFVALILFFSFLYAGYKWVFPKELFRLNSGAFPKDLSILIFVLAFGLLSFLSRIILPMGGGYLAARPLASMVLFATSFFLGTLAWKYQWPENLSLQQAKRWFYLALLFMIAPLILFLIMRKNVSFATIKGSGTIASLVYSYWEVIKVVGTGMMAIVIFRDYINKQGRLASGLGRSAFAAYVLHPLICVLVMFLMADVSWHPLLKFSLVAPVSLILTFGVSWMFVKIPGINRVF